MNNPGNRAGRIGRHAALVLAAIAIVGCSRGAEPEQGTVPEQATSLDTPGADHSPIATAPWFGPAQSAREEVASGIQDLLHETGGWAQIRIDPLTDVATFVSIPAGTWPSLPGASLDEKATMFFALHGGLFGIESPDEQLTLRRQRAGQVLSHLTFQQRHEGVAVFGSVLNAHFNRDGELVAINGTYAPDVAVDTSPSWDWQQAGRVAVARVVAQFPGRALSVVGAELLVFRSGLLRRVDGIDHLVYEIEVADPNRTVRELVYVDAHFGKVVDQISGIRNALHREVSEQSLGNVVWVEGDPDPITPGFAGGSAQQVEDWQGEIDGARETYNAIASMTNGTYLSYDGADAEAMLTVNNDPGIDCPNANWNGTSTNYCSGVTGDDTVAHEWGHAYTEYTNNLIYQWQSGALNEAYSDIWGEVVDLINGRGSDAPGGLRTAGGCSTFGNGSPSVDASYRWLSGEDDPAFNGAIRDLWAPTCYGDPGKLTDPEYHCDTTDGGGVHTNSGVPNHAFALVVDGGTYNGQTVTGLGIDKAARIYWEAQNIMTASSNFEDHADALETACAALIGAIIYTVDSSSPAGVDSGETVSSADCAEVGKAIAAVELRTEPTQCGFTTLLDTSTPPALCGGGAPVIHELQDFEGVTIPAASSAECGNGICEGGDSENCHSCAADCAGVTKGKPSNKYCCGSTEGCGNSNCNSGGSSCTMTPVPDANVWASGTRAVANEATFDTPDWAVVTSLPDRSGSGAFVADDQSLGDCQADTEAGVLFLESPIISIPGSANAPGITFEHNVATEQDWDGGNVKISVNGGPYALISSSRFTFNPYNGALNSVAQGNDNPLAGESAFTGTDGGSVSGTWGQSQIDLAGLAGAGDDIRLRFEMGLDGCNGVVGWYVDDVTVYSCACVPSEASELSCSDGQDNDCDAAVDCDDPDCDADAACQTTTPCQSPGELEIGCACSVNAECAGNKCRGKSGQKTCK